MDKLVARLQRWCDSQPGVRLIKGPPLDDVDIDKLPARIAAAHRGRLPVPFDAEAFPVPAGYRELLRLHRHVRVEFDDEDTWRTYEPVNLLDPDAVVRGPSFIAGATLDERP